MADVTAAGAPADRRVVVSRHRKIETQISEPVVHGLARRVEPQRHLRLVEPRSANRRTCWIGMSSDAANV